MSCTVQHQVRNREASFFFVKPCVEVSTGDIRHVGSPIRLGSCFEDDQKRAARGRPVALQQPSPRRMPMRSSAAVSLHGIAPTADSLSRCVCCPVGPTSYLEKRVVGWCEWVYDVEVGVAAPNGRNVLGTYCFVICIRVHTL